MSESLKCVLLPLSKDRIMVLPNNSLAEVVDNREDLLVMGARDGIIGKIQWRGNSVPLVSFEAAIGEVIPGHGLDARIAVIFSPSGDPSLPYLALSIQGTPRFKETRATDFISNPSQELSHLVSHYVDMGDEYGIIPNMSTLETFVKMRLN